MKSAQILKSQVTFLATPPSHSIIARSSQFVLDKMESINTNANQVPEVVANELVEDVEMPELTEQELKDVEEVSTSEPTTPV